MSNWVACLEERSRLRIVKDNCRALELTKREQAILERERETDELHSEALRLNQEAKEKSNEADRLLYSKRKYVDELENARKQVASREAELNDLERIKDGANSNRMAVVLLEIARDSCGMAAGRRVGVLAHSLIVALRCDL